MLVRSDKIKKTNYSGTVLRGHIEKNVNNTDILMFPSRESISSVYKGET